MRLSQMFSFRQLTGTLGSCTTIVKWVAREDIVTEIPTSSREGIESTVVVKARQQLGGAMMVTEEIMAAWDLRLGMAA